MSVESQSRSAEPLPYGRQWLDEDDIAAVVEVLRGDWLTQGPMVAAFEKSLAQACGARHAVAVSSGTAALHLAAIVAGVGPGDIGLTSPITFVASANCVAYCGGVLRFADVDPRTVTLSPEKLEKACRQQPPKVIIPVDFAGQPADLPAIFRIAKQYGALVIEDAAHALGATYTHDGRVLAAGACIHSDLAVLSFHPVKHIATGEGGAILTNDSALFSRLVDLRTHGITREPKRLTRIDGPWYHEQHELGFNYRITDFQCALGLSQLRKLACFVQRRRELVDRYQDRLANHEPEVTLLTESPGRRSSYHLLVARLAGGPDRRKRIFEGLQAQNIRPQVHYIPVHLQPWYRRQGGFQDGDFPESEAYYSSCLSLPLFPRMNDEDVDRVADALIELLEQTR